jgi:hypothetical protein
MSLLDHRLQIPELRLRQGQNQLTVKGTMALPQPGANWWERQFDFKVDADIRNLTDLSALLLPEFKYAAGQLFIRGSVSGSGSHDGQPPNYEGQLVASGTNLQWHTAPIENIQAAFLFHDREFQIISAQLMQKADYLRGTGHISLVDGSYAGEWRLSVRDLATYKSVLTPYLLPAPLGGGAEVTWLGTGTGGNHSGNFTARLDRFHLLGPGGTLPLDAEFSGRYRPGEMQLEKVRLAEDGTSLTADISIGPSAVNVTKLSVQHRNRTWLHGDAFLPLDLWQHWPDVTLTRLLNDETVCRVRLDAEDLDIAATSRLTGIDWPLAGSLSGQLSADGALGALKLGGSLRLLRGKIPLNWHGAIVRDVDAAFTLEGTGIRLEKAAGKHPGGDFTGSGRLDLSQPRDPRIDAEISGNDGSGTFQLKVSGPTAKPEIIKPPVPAPPPAATPPLLPASPPPPAPEKK